MGGAALHLGNVAEMKTGEGKTLVATLPSYLNALDGQGRARHHGQRLPRRVPVRADGPRAPLPRPRDRLHPRRDDARAAPRRVRQGHHLRHQQRVRLRLPARQHGVVDRASSCSAATTSPSSTRSTRSSSTRPARRSSSPARPTTPTKWYVEFAKIVARLERGELRDGRGDYEVDEKKRTVGVLESRHREGRGPTSASRTSTSRSTPRSSATSTTPSRPRSCSSATRTTSCMNGEMLIVDEHTGRMLAGRRYNEGMHQAIEAKEGVEIQNENQTLATITLQNYFRMYDKLSGMTGTAQTEAAELNSIYKLGVVPIPTNRPMIRNDQADLVYRTEEAKYNAVVDDIVERHENGQPVLVGTVSVEKSEYLSEQLRRHGVRHEVLNAKQHEREADHRRRCRPQGRRHRRDQHGRSRHRHHARRQPRVPGRRRAQGARPRPARDAGGVRGGLGRGARRRRGGRRRRARRGHRPRWALRARHRAARVAPHRQPAAWPLRPPGRPGRVAVLPLARGRPHAPVQRRAWSTGS